jgi:Ras-related GTP-binding protein A/B
MEYYQETIKAIIEFSPSAKIFCFIHKVDLLKSEIRESYCNEKIAILNELTLPKEMMPFKTSIWDETLYRV